MPEKTVRAGTAFVSLTSEPARARAMDTVLLGHLIGARLENRETEFAKVWRDHIVPLEAACVTDWQRGMTVQLSGLTSDAGKGLNGMVGRIAGPAPVSVAPRLEVMIRGPDGLINVLPENLKATAHPAAILYAWRHLVPKQSPYAAVVDAARLVRKPDGKGPLPVTGE